MICPSVVGGLGRLGTGCVGTAPTGEGTVIEVSLLGAESLPPSLPTSASSVATCWASWAAKRCMVASALPVSFLDAIAFA